MASQQSQDFSGVVNNVSTAMVVLTISFVALRFISRTYSKAGLWYDDWLALASLPFTLAISASFYYATKNGYGTEEGNVVFYLQVVYVDEILWYTSFLLTKLSVLFFYKRVFGPSPGLGIVLKTVGGITIAWWIALLFSSIFQCSPISGAWEHGPGSVCFGLEPFFLAQTVPNLITDFAILFIPLPILWRLHLRASRKAFLVFIFLVSYFVPIISIVRIAFFIQLYVKKGDNSTYQSVLASIWSILEPAMALVSVCIPSLSWLFNETLTVITNSFHSLQSQSSLPDSTNKPFSSGAGNRHGMFSTRKTKLDGNDSLKHLHDEQLDKFKHDQYQVSASTGDPTDSRGGDHGMELNHIGPQIHVRDEMNVKYERAPPEV